MQTVVVIVDEDWTDAGVREGLCEARIIVFCSSGLARWVGSTSATQRCLEPVHSPSRMLSPSGDWTMLVMVAGNAR
jgi:hypothetical protein